MYNVNPFRYLVDGLLSTTLANTLVTCASNEYLDFQSPANMTCADFMAPYIDSRGGYLLQPEEGFGASCQFCTVRDTNAFLKGIHSDFSLRWRNFGILWAYVAFNITAAVFLYWLVRVPKVKKDNKQEKGEKTA